VDAVRLAHVLYGPVHALVAQLAHNRTAYAIRHACALERRAIDAAAATLERAGILARDGPVFRRVTISTSRVVAVFGAKYAATLMVWPGLARAAPRRRRRRRQPNSNSRD
jgi:hypothetical protein